MSLVIFDVEKFNIFQYAKDLFMTRNIDGLRDRGMFHVIEFKNMF
jgi:hypothetical protein